jgi:hypothetical protein
MPGANNHGPYRAPVPQEPDTQGSVAELLRRRRARGCFERSNMDENASETEDYAWISLRRL